MHSDQSRAQIPKDFLYQALTLLSHYPPAPVTPGPGTRLLMTALMSQMLLKLFKLANHKSAYPGLPFLSFGNNYKVLATFSSHSFASQLTLVFPLTMICPLLLDV